MSFDSGIIYLSSRLTCFPLLKHFFLMINRNPELLKGVYNMGFNRPSRIQENALPMMLAQP